MTQVKKQTKRPNNKQCENALFENEKILRNSKEEKEFSLSKFKEKQRERTSMKCVELVTGLWVFSDLFRSIKSHKATRVSGGNIRDCNEYKTVEFPISRGKAFPKVLHVYECSVRCS